MWLWAAGETLTRREFTLDLADKPVWGWDHDLPVLWPWLFEAHRITESRRLHNTVLDAGALFSARLARCRDTGPWGAMAAALDGITPDRFFRELDVPPDTVLRLDLAPLEARRPYRHEEASARWEEFWTASEAGNRPAASAAWEAATLNPLRPSGRVQRDAEALARLALQCGFPRRERARALVYLLFGEPLSRPAKALTFKWVEEAEQLPAVAYRETIAWWRMLFRR